ncbi:hypothetical protein D3C83_323940 [compost metagenome]
MLHIGCCRQQQQSPAEPFFEVFLQFVIQLLQTKNSPQHEAEHGNRNQTDENA